MIKKGQVLNGTIAGTSSSGVHSVNLGGTYNLLKVPSCHPKDQYFDGQNVAIGFINPDAPIILSRGFRAPLMVSVGNYPNPGPYDPIEPIIEPPLPIPIEGETKNRNPVIHIALSWWEGEVWGWGTGTVNSVLLTTDFWSSSLGYIEASFRKHWIDLDGAPGNRDKGLICFYRLALSTLTLNQYLHLRDTYMTLWFDNIVLNLNSSINNSVGLPTDIFCGNLASVLSQDISKRFLKPLVNYMK